MIVVPKIEHVTRQCSKQISCRASDKMHSLMPMQNIDVDSYVRFAIHNIMLDSL